MLSFLLVAFEKPSWTDSEGWGVGVKSSWSDPGASLCVCSFTENVLKKISGGG